jgi:hypothetical protein
VIRSIRFGPKVPPTQIDNRAIINLHPKETAIPFITRLDPGVITDNVDNRPVLSVIPVEIRIRGVGNINPDTVTLLKPLHCAYL